MGRRVWKFPLRDVINELFLPAGSTVLHVDYQSGAMCLWAEVDPSAAVQRRTFEVVGTGHPITRGTVHVGSLLADGGQFVFHIYEVEQGDSDG